MQQKRGTLAKLDKDKLLPGEFAIPTDSDSIFVCLSAGNVIEIPSKQAMQSLLDTLTEVVNKGETIIDDFEALEVEKAAINDNETSTVTTYSSEKIMQLIDAINEFAISIVEALPTENIDTHTIYFVAKEESENDVYDEFIYINNAWEHIGSTEIDLSGYYTSEQVEEIKSELQGEIDLLNSKLNNIPSIKFARRTVVRNETYTNIVQAFISGVTANSHVFVSPRTAIPGFINRINSTDSGVIQIVFSANLSADTEYTFDIFAIN